MSHHKPCRIAIIGTGRIGRLHAENIIKHMPQFQLYGVADPALDQQWLAQWGILRATNHPEELLQDDEVDAVLLASPSDQHISQLSMACAQRKAIFCEKPLGLDEDGILTVLDRVAREQILLQVGFNRRYDPHFAALQGRVRAGEIGQPHTVKITSRDPACPPLAYIAQSGGIFMDMSIHDFDMARFIAGAEVKEVYATGAVLINPEIEAYQDVDTAIIQLKFANGCLGIIDNSRQAVYGYDQRLEIFGSQGMLWVDNVKGNQVQALGQAHHIQSKPEYFFLQRYQQAYINELMAFYHAWANKTDSPVPGYAGLQALRIAQAARQSLFTHQPVVLEN